MKRSLCALIALAGLTACAEVPNNPTVDVMPRPGETWQHFSMARDYCVSQAKNRVAATAHTNNIDGTLGALATTALGAGLGAAIGGGSGAAIGAGAGALGGAAGGGLYAGSGNTNIQQSFNMAYMQCMSTTP